MKHLQQVCEYLHMNGHVKFSANYDLEAEALANSPTGNCQNFLGDKDTHLFVYSFCICCMLLSSWV